MVLAVKKWEKGSLGVGNKSIWNKVADSRAFSIIGGGDTIAAARKFKVDNRISYICTAGGGLVLFLSGVKLPVIKALTREV